MALIPSGSDRALRDVEEQVGKLEAGPELSEGGMPLPVVGSFGPLWNLSSTSHIPGEGCLYSRKPATALCTPDVSGTLGLPAFRSSQERNSDAGASRA